MTSFTLPNTQAGGSITVDAPSLGAAQQAAATQTGVSLSQQVGGGTFGVNTSSTLGGGGSSGGGGGGGGGSSSASADLGRIQQQLSQAIASGNKAAADEAIREFNQTFGLDQQKFAEAVNEYNQNFGLAQAGLTGTLNGVPTLAAQQQAANIAAQAAGLTGYYQPPTFTSASAGPSASSSAAPSAYPNSAYAEGTFVKGPGPAIGVIQGGQLHIFPSFDAFTAAGGKPDLSNVQTVGQSTFDSIWSPNAPGVNVAPPPAPATSAPTAAATTTPTTSTTADPRGIPTLALQQQQATLSGQYNGAPTEDARQFNVTAQQNALNASNDTAQKLLALAASLHADPIRQLQIMYGANGVDGIRNAVNGISGQYGLSGNFTAPGAAGNTANLGGLVGSFNGAPQQYQSMQGVLGSFPSANQIIARNYNNAPQNVQDFTTSALSANNGLDQASNDKLIQNTLPKFHAPSFGLATV